MSLFCVLWMPFFYFFWRSLSRDDSGKGVWALLLGSIVGMGQFFVGSLVEPGGFGLSRWASACIDLIALPAILPMLLYGLFRVLRIFPASSDFTGFNLLYLMPGAAIRGVNWSSQADPVHLVLVPILWTALAGGIPFFIRLLSRARHWYAALPLVPLILALPFLAASSWWAFFCQRLSLGIPLLVAANLPLVIGVTAAFVRNSK